MNQTGETCHCGGPGEYGCHGVSAGVVVSLTLCRGCYLGMDDVSIRREALS